MKRIFLMFLAFSIFATAAYAHNGMIHVMGTVTSITDSSISVKGADGKIQTVMFAATTKFLKGESAISAKDIKVGDRTVIHATKKGDQLVASEVKLGTTATSGNMRGMKMDHSPATPH